MVCHAVHGQNDDEDPFGHGYDEDWDELDSLTDDDDYDAVGRVMEGLSGMLGHHPLLSLESLSYHSG